MLFWVFVICDDPFYAFWKLSDLVYWLTEVQGAMGELDFLEFSQENNKWRRICVFQTVCLSFSVVVTKNENWIIVTLLDNFPASSPTHPNLLNIWSYQKNDKKVESGASNVVSITIPQMFINWLFHRMHNWTNLYFVPLHSTCDSNIPLLTMQYFQKLETTNSTNNLFKLI